MFWPCETKTSTCRNFATISSGLYRFLAITVLLDVKDIPQVGLLQRGRITETGEIAVGGNRGRSRDCSHIFMRPTTKRRERELHDVVAHGAVDVRAIAQSATGQALVAQRIKRGYKYSRALRDVSLHPPPPHPGQLAYVHTEGRRDGREVDARVVTTYPEACFR